MKRQNCEKTIQRMGTIFLTFALLMQNTAVATSVRAESVSQNNSSISAETASASDLKNPIHYCDKENPKDNDYTEWSYVYFGSYPQTEVTDSSIIDQIDANLSDSGDTLVNGVKYRKIRISDANNNYYFNEHKYVTFRYFKWEPILWKVLNTDGSKAFLASAKGLDCQEYNEEYADVTWETCSIRKWLNGYSGYTETDRNRGQSFTVTDFYSTAFNETEQKAILQTTLINSGDPDIGAAGGNDTTDKVFLLSWDDIRNTAYGFCEDDYCQTPSRQVKVTDYGYAIGAFADEDETTPEDQMGTNWWLRSHGSLSSTARGVYVRGNAERGGQTAVDDNHRAVVPAVYLNLSSNVWNVANSGSTNTNTEKKIITPSNNTITLNTPVLSLKKAKKSFKATWKKAGDVDGYELQYSLKKNFKSFKTKKISAKKTSITVKKLKSKKKYYVRIRSYKLSNGEKKYSLWSKKKNVKTK